MDESSRISVAQVAHFDRTAHVGDRHANRLLVRVLIAALIRLLFTGIAKFSGGGYGNRRVPEFQARLSGFRQRAHWAHLNGFEAFPPFAAGVIIVHPRGAPAERIDQLPIAFIVLRLIYGAFYLADLHWLRSLAWTTTFACTIGPYLLAGNA